tara:strand:+ start:546 stop:662 length:117 start_codon:yes stop_codon:yes gene_type:complete
MRYYAGVESIGLIDIPRSLARFLLKQHKMVIKIEYPLL